MYWLANHTEKTVAFLLLLLLLSSFFFSPRFYLFDVSGNGSTARVARNIY